MRLPRAFSALAGACLLVLACPVRAAWHAQEEIPVESPVYRLLDDLASTYPLSRGLLLTRPWTRGDLGRFLDQLVIDDPVAKDDPAVLRLWRELEPGGGAQGLEPAISTEDDDASLEVSPYLHFGYAEDRSVSSVLRDNRAGVQISAAFGDHALLFSDAYVGNVTPGPHGTPDANGSFTATSGGATAWLDRAYVTWAGPGFSARAGHTWLDWGPGAGGSMALSDGSPAFDLVEARARLVGGAQLEWFVAALDAGRESYLAGHRLEMRAGPSVEFSLSELARFDGAGNAPVYLVPVVPYGLIDRGLRNGGTDRTHRNNVMYASDFTWTWRPGMRIYGELAVDDATFDKSRPLAAAWQAGAELRQRAAGGVWTLRGQFDRVFPFTYSSNSLAPFIHDGFATGFLLGPDVERVSGRLEWRPAPDYALGIEGADVRKGRNQLGQAWQPGDPVPPLLLMLPVHENRRVALTADWSPSPSVSVDAVAGRATQSIAGVSGSGRDGSVLTAQATFRW